jgi:predicted nucleic acid-binding protein
VQPVLGGSWSACIVSRRAPRCRSDREARLVERGFRQFEIVSLLDPALAIIAAANYRLLRARGVTMAKMAGPIIGTFCIERGHTLLHSDRDFAPMQRLPGLQTV